MIRIAIRNGIVRRIGQMPGAFPMTTAASASKLNLARTNMAGQKTTSRLSMIQVADVRKPKPAGTVLPTGWREWNILPPANHIVRGFSPRRNPMRLALAVIPIGKTAVVPAMAR